jgi:hypothetical protein
VPSPASSLNLCGFRLELFRLAQPEAIRPDFRDGVVSLLTDQGYGEDRHGRVFHCRPAQATWTKHEPRRHLLHFDPRKAPHATRLAGAAAEPRGGQPS